MRKITQRRLGGPEVLEIAQAPTPQPAPGQVLIEMAAAGVNPVDVNVRAGYFPLLGEPPFSVGWDVAGTVREVGDEVDRWRVGDEVFGMIAFPKEAAAHADLVLADADELAPVPASLTLVEAGALPLAGLTAWQALVDIADVQSGQTVVISRAAGGVGHLAVQIAAARGAHVVAVASETKHGLLRELGATQTVDYRTTDIGSLDVRADVVLDLLGGDDAEQYLRLVRPGGIFLAIMPGQVDAAAAHAHGARFAGHLVQTSSANLDELAALADRGKLRVHVEHEYPLADVARAHEHVATGRVTGKLVLVP